MVLTPLRTAAVTADTPVPATAPAIAVPCPVAPWQMAQLVAYMVAPEGKVGVAVGVVPGAGAGVGVALGA